MPEVETIQIHGLSRWVQLNIQYPVSRDLKLSIAEQLARQIILEIDRKIAPRRVKDAPNCRSRLAVEIDLPRVGARIAGYAITIPPSTLKV
jgi:hypothetical protein